MNKLFIFSIFILSSCSTSVSVESTQCSKNMLLFSSTIDKGRVNSFSYTQSGFGDLEIDLSKAFESKGHSCKNIKEATYELESRPKDVFLGLIPGFTSKTIRVYYR